MNLLLRLHDNPADPVWSVIFSICLLLVGVMYIIVYLIDLDNKENLNK